MGYTQHARLHAMYNDQGKRSVIAIPQNSVATTENSLAQVCASLLSLTWCFWISVRLLRDKVGT
jgi:hypothetical protein